MIVGILSDSHGDAAATARAVALLESRGAEALFFCGDACGEAVLEELAGRRAYFVWGNCDDLGQFSRAYITDTLGLPWPQVPVRVTLGGRRIAMYHGHEREFRDAARGDADYVLFGHTHKYEDARVGPVRMINPGALYRARVKTVATLDLARNALMFLTLEGREVGLRV